jgi:hypothetical protein
MESSSFLLSGEFLKTNGNHAQIGIAVKKSQKEITVENNYGTSSAPTLAEQYEDFGKTIVFMSYSMGKTLAFLKNAFYFGIAVDLADTFYMSSEQWDQRRNLTYFKVFQNAQSSYSTVTGSLTVPLVTDINLFNSSHFAVFRIEPKIWGLYAKKDSGIKNRNVGIGLDYLSLGLKGKMSEKLEYFIVPSIQSNIFFTGLELRYSFGK